MLLAFHRAESAFEREIVITGHVGLSAVDNWENNSLAVEANAERAVEQVESSVGCTYVNANCAIFLIDSDRVVSFGTHHCVCVCEREREREILKK